MIDRNILLNALQSANKALKGANAELNLEAKDGQILISGVSQNISIWSQAEGEMDDMRIAVKAASVITALSKLSDEKICLDLSDAGLIISGKRAKVTLPVFEFVDHRRAAEFESEVKTDHLAPYVEQVVHALDDHGYNPLMSAIHMEVFANGGFQLTALDGKRYSVRNTAGKGGTKVSEFVVFGREFNEALRLMGDGPVTIYRPKGGKFVRMKNDSLEIEIGLPEGNYFDIGNLKTTFPVHVILKKEDLENAVELVKMMSKIALIDISATEMLISGKDVQGSTEMKIPVKSKGIDPDRTIRTAFNAQFILDAAKSIASSDLMIHLKDGMNQFCMTDGRHAVEMVLPVRRTN